MNLHFCELIPHDMMSFTYLIYHLPFYLNILILCAVLDNFESSKSARTSSSISNAVWLANRLASKKANGRSDLG